MRYIEFGGGLGDVIHQVFTDGGYRSLERLSARDRVKVGIISHNPACHTLFDHHPRRDQMELVTPGYWGPADDIAMRRQFGLPKYHGTPTDESIPVRFYSDPASEAEVDAVVGRSQVLVVAPCAGESDRDLPEKDLNLVLRRAEVGRFTLVQIGKDYSRNDRPSEFRIRNLFTTAPIIDWINQLSVPATLRLIAGAEGVVTAHSAVNMMAWYLHRRQLLLYPPHVQDRHFLRPDQWSFGVWKEPYSALTHHGLFGDRHPVETFFASLQNKNAP